MHIYNLFMHIFIEMASNDGYDSEVEFMASSLDPTSTPFGAKLRRIEYNWVVLYDWNLNEGRPFHNELLKKLVGKSCPEWVTGPISDSFRLQKRTFKSLEGKKVSIFAKIQIGTFVYTFWLRNWLPE